VDKTLQTRGKQGKIPRQVDHSEIGLRFKWVLVGIFEKAGIAGL